MKLKYDFEIVEIDDEIMAVPVGDNAADLHAMLRLNDSAGYILGLLKEDITPDEIVARVLTEYDSDPDTAAAYVRDFITELQEKELIE